VRIDALHRWGSGLASNGATEELRAAGRAIQLLVDHIDTHELAAKTEREASVGPPSDGKAEPAQNSVLGALADRIGTRP